MGFGNSAIQNSAIRPNIGRQLFFRKTYHHIFLPFKIYPLIRIIYFCSLIFVFFPQNSKFRLWVKSTEEFSRGVLTDRKVLASKSMRSQLSNALSNAFIALLVAEISSSQFQKSPSTHLCRAFSNVDFLRQFSLGWEKC